jgi:hypothetical protein
MVTPAAVMATSPNFYNVANAVTLKPTLADALPRWPARQGVRPLAQWWWV